MNKVISVANKTKILLVLVLILGFTLRIFQVDKFPMGLNADEAAIGYNAYSIIKTGRDEYGEILPLSFKSFGDYKPGLYFYFVIPFVATLGLTEFAVRIPSVLLGTGLIYLIYLIGQQIFKDNRISFFAALFLSINPWAIHFSRGGWESNAATFFIALGIWFFIKGLEKKRYIFWSLFSMLISMYLYQSPRLIVPILLLGISVAYRKDLTVMFKNNIKQIGVSLIILLILSLPLASQFISGGGNARFSGLSSFADPGPGNRVNELRGEHINSNGLSAGVFHNKIIAYGVNFLGHYLDHFTPNFFFIEGDPLIRNKVPETAQFYLIESIFLLAGILFLVQFKSRFKYLLILWILISPLASSITYQTPHAVRALSMVVPLTLLISLGFVSMLRLIKTRRLKIVVGILLILILGFEFVKYLENYYVHYPKRYPLSWEYGFSEMIQKLNEYEKGVNKVVITDKYDQPYILTLFYKKYDPTQYQPQAVLSERDKFNFGTVRKFDKYEFHPIKVQDINNSTNTLFVASPEEVGDEVNIIDSVNFPNGEKAFVFVKS